MGLNRLTKSGESKYVHCNIDDECTGQCGTCKRNIEIREKLKYYEDLEEQGMLIKLQYQLDSVSNRFCVAYSLGFPSEYCKDCPDYV